MKAKAEPVPHIRLDDAGRPWLDDSNVKVIEVVLDHLAYGWNAETIQENHPHLSLAQVYAALAWYYDHQAEMDAVLNGRTNASRPCEPPANRPPCSSDWPPSAESGEPGPLWTCTRPGR